MAQGFGYPSDDPCRVCDGHKNNQSEPRFGYTVCEDHQSVPPTDLDKERLSRKERESVARQVNEAILEMIDDLDTTDRPDRPEDDYDVLLHDLQQDLLATSTALKQLEASGHEVKIERAALDSVRLRLVRQVEIGKGDGDNGV